MDSIFNYFKVSSNFTFNLGGGQRIFLFFLFYLFFLFFQNFTST